MKVVIEYSDQAVWDALTGCDFADTGLDLQAIRIDSWETPGPIRVQVLNGQWTVITWEEVTGIFADLVRNYETHCGGYPLGDLLESDSCLAEVVLTRALGVEDRTWTDTEPEEGQ